MTRACRCTSRRRPGSFRADTLIVDVEKWLEPQPPTIAREAISARDWAAKVGGKGATVAKLGGDKSPALPFAAGVGSDRLQAWKAALEQGDRTAPPDSKRPDTLPFKDGPPAGEHATGTVRNKGGTVAAMGDPAGPVLPFGPSCDEAERARQAAKQARDDAEQLDDTPVGGFGPKKS